MHVIRLSMPIWLSLKQAKRIIILRFKATLKVAFFVFNFQKSVKNHKFRTNRFKIRIIKVDQNTQNGHETNLNYIIPASGAWD